MELELSLGVSPALAKGTVKHMLTCTRAGDGEGHGLVLELGVRTAKGDELDNNLKTSMQPEDMMQGEDDLYQGCLLPTASAETGRVNSSLQVEVPMRQAAKDNGGFGGRIKKKPRLSKEQYGFLEDSFKEHSILTPRQTSDLARRLNLEPRQVAIWFQNRRARTRLQQTKEECEKLKRGCAALTRENRRLQAEVAELRALLTNKGVTKQLLGSVGHCPISCDCEATTTCAEEPAARTDFSWSTPRSKPRSAGKKKNG